MSTSPKDLYDRLIDASSDGETVAIRTISTYQPMAGEGAKVFPPTYPNPDRGEGGAVYLSERRIVPGHDEPVDAVLLDGPASQANRNEEALARAVRRGLITMPLLELLIEVNGRALRLTSLDASHRAADAAWRDSELEGVPFYESELGRRLRLANVENARPLLEIYPTSASLGYWYSRPNDSTDMAINRNNAKVARAYTSDVVAIGVEQGSRPASRIDRLDIRAVEVYAEADGDSWTADPAAAVGGPKSPKPFGKKKNASAVGHSNIAPSIELGGVTMRYAVGRSTLSFPRLRMLEFPVTPGELSDPAADAAARALLAALTLVGDRLARSSLSLRSGCDLVATDTVTEWLDNGGVSDPVTIDTAEAVGCFELAVEAAKDAGFVWDTEPVRLTPSSRLVGLLEASDLKAVTSDEEE